MECLVWLVSMPSFCHKFLVSTFCPRNYYPFYIISYYINWVTTSWTYSIIADPPTFFYRSRTWFTYTVCLRSLDPFHTVSYNMKLVKTSWTDSRFKYWTVTYKHFRICDDCIMMPEWTMVPSVQEVVSHFMQ